MKAFVRRWYRATPERAKLFLDDIAKDEHRGLRELARVPLLLALLCLGFDDTLRFPLRRVEVYRDALDTLLRRWDSSRDIRRDEIYRFLSSDRKHQLFAAIAAQTFERGDYFIAQDDLETQITGFLSGLPRADLADDAVVDGTVVLKAVEAQHGVLVERAHRIHSFAHLSFQEYYAARYIDANEARGTLSRLLSHCADDRWREVILLTASLLANADRFFLHFRRAVDALLGEDERLREFLGWAKRKSAGLRTGYRPVALRSYYLALDLDRASDRAPDLDLNRALTRALASASDLTRDLTSDLARVSALASDLHRARAFDLARALASDLHAPSPAPATAPGTATAPSNGLRRSAFNWACSRCIQHCPSWKPPPWMHRPRTMLRFPGSCSY